MKKSSKKIIIVIAFFIIAVTEIVLVNTISRATFTRETRKELNLNAQLRTLEFVSSMNEQLTLVRQMVKTPSIVKYLSNPKDTAMEKEAFENFLAYKNSFLSKSIFWISSKDLKFWSDMKYAYTVDPSLPTEYWYNMTMFETEEYNFNINFNEALNMTMLWVNAVVRDDKGTPIGIAGTGVPIQYFVDSMYKGLNKKITMYLYNDKDEVVGSLDSSIIKDKLCIYDIFPYLKTIESKPTEIVFKQTLGGEYLLAPMTLVN